MSDARTQARLAWPTKVGARALRGSAAATRVPGWERRATSPATRAPGCVRATGRGVSCAGRGRAPRHCSTAVALMGLRRAVERRGPRTNRRGSSRNPTFVAVTAVALLGSLGLRRAAGWGHIASVRDRAYRSEVCGKSRPKGNYHLYKMLALWCCNSFAHGRRCRMAMLAT